jgi:membrane-bound ClpP family serine protease
MEGSLTLAYVLIVVGFVLLAAELFLPSGLMAVVALILVFVGVTLTFSHGTTTGLITLAVVVVLLPVAGAVMFRVWPKTWLGRRFFLNVEEEAATGQTTANQELEQLIGRYGKTLSDLRPSGVADFDGRRVDVITEGLTVDADQWVRCIDVRAGRVTVRPSAAPDLGKLESADF